MSLAGLLNQPLTIQRRGVVGTDEYGNDVLGTVSTPAAVGYVEQTAAKEITVGQETYTTDWLVVLPAGTAIDGSDRIVHDGRLLEVIGSPHEAWNPRRRAVDHVEVRAREVTG